MPAFADVALALPLDAPFTYAVPSALERGIAVGSRVRVPFQSRMREGTCVRLHDEAPAFAVRPVSAVTSPRPLLTPALLRVCRAIARRYACGIGEAIDAAIPFGVKRGRARRMIWIAAPNVPVEQAARAVDELQPTVPKQARALRHLLEAGEPLALNDLMRAAKVSRSPIANLAERGLVALYMVPAAVDPAFEAPAIPEPQKALTLEQQAALQSILQPVEVGRHGAFLLFGVTGSGKTEVYLRALARVVDRGRQAIVLVPEIALTPQTAARFRARFPRIAVLHSGLTEAERQRHWQKIADGEIDVVVGARSAIFAPLPALGLIVLDEEHENTFKQQNTPRYDAREVARLRARFERAVLVLGSATPSLESWRKAEVGRLGLLRLTTRVAGGSFPDTIIADLRQTLSVPGKRGRLTDRLRAAMAHHRAAGGQVILFLNRRGYATSAVCPACGEMVECPNCDIVLVYHRKIGRILCHYCGHEEPLPPTCPKCAGPFRLYGFGTEKIEEEVLRALPGARVARMDSDTMKARGAHDVVLSKFRRGEIDVLIGTQMIAKGLDFPNVTLVGIVAADTMLDLPDYRSAERTFSLLAQVAGRTGRSARGGTVIVQTQCPDHFAIHLALEHDFERFAKIELESRRRDGYPPFGHLARIVLHDRDEERLVKIAAELGAALRSEGSGFELLGPAPAPIAMINGEHRQHLVAKSPLRSGIRDFVARARAATRKLKEWPRALLDVDPWAML